MTIDWTIGPIKSDSSIIETAFPIDGSSCSNEGSDFARNLVEGDKNLGNSFVAWLCNCSPNHSIE